MQAKLLALNEVVGITNLIKTNHHYQLFNKFFRENDILYKLMVKPKAKIYIDDQD